MIVLAFQDKYVRGWPKSDDARAVHAPIGDVLTERFSTDLHFVPYGADIARRHTIALFKDPTHADKIGTANLRMVLFVVDVDHPQHAAQAFAAPDAWWTEERGKLEALFAVHPGGFVYRTRGGYRIVYALPEPFPLRAQLDDDRWTARYKSSLRYLARRFGIVADEACADWTRFYRAPHATRDGILQDLETIGDAHAIGTWAPELIAADRVRVPRPRATFGEVSPIDLGDLDGAYARARVDAGVHYLRTAPLSIEGQRGRDTFFSIACTLVRRQRLRVDVAAELVDAIYNPRLVAIGTSPWVGDELINRLESARDTAAEVPPGDVPDEATWCELASAGIVL